MRYVRSNLLRNSRKSSWGSFINHVVNYNGGRSFYRLRFIPISKCLRPREKRGIWKSEKNEHVVYRQSLHRLTSIILGIEAVLENNYRLFLEGMHIKMVITANGKIGIEILRGFLEIFLNDIGLS